MTTLRTCLGALALLAPLACAPAADTPASAMHAASDVAADAPAAMPASSDVATDMPAAAMHASSDFAAADAPVAPEFVGVVVARASVDLASQVPGRLVAVHAALGDHVEAGALLARIEAPTLPAELAAAAAAVTSAEAALAEHRLQVADARRQLAHERELADAEFSSRHAREQAELTLRRAEAGERRLAAQLAERRARVLELQAQRAGGELVAPFAGTLASWYRPPGAVVDVGERLVRVAALEQLWVRFAVPVAALAGVRPGDEVMVTPEPTSGPLRAVVRRVAPELDLASQMVLVEAELLESGAVQAGQACRVGPGSGARTAAIIVSSVAPGAP